MYYHQQIATRSTISQIWQQAYIDGSFKIDYSNDENSMFKVRQAYIALTNYRRYVRTKRLNPLYKDEWLQISKCTIRIPNTPVLTISIRKDFYQDRLLKKQLNRHPFKNLPIPTSVVNL